MGNSHVKQFSMSWPEKHLGYLAMLIVHLRLVTKNYRWINVSTCVMFFSYSGIGMKTENI